MSFMDVSKIVGANVRKARIEAGISQEELAGRMDVEQFYISGLEAGRRTSLW
ncbi:putative transcriptional regulator [Bradyrhizobium sp. LB12.1]|uniref:helix-turn-helix domain-containing protein n=1 Tax=Bradyrhizobium sp. LB12.1 TaxID=3156327 RepID=UPI003391495A